MIERGKRSALALNDRILARTEEAGKGHVAHPMKKLQRSADLIQSTFHVHQSKTAGRPFADTTSVVEHPQAQVTVSDAHGYLDPSRLGVSDHV